jgi:hypothetical protein
LRRAPAASAGRAAPLCRGAAGVACPGDASAPHSALPTIPWRRPSARPSRRASSTSSPSSASWCPHVGVKALDVLVLRRRRDLPGRRSGAYRVPGQRVTPCLRPTSTARPGTVRTAVRRRQDSPRRSVDGWLGWRAKGDASWVNWCGHKHNRSSSCPTGSAGIGGGSASSTTASGRRAPPF